MRQLKLLNNGWKMYKYGDTQAIMRFSVSSDGFDDDLSNSKLVFNIKNDHGYVTSVTGYLVENTKNEVEFHTEDAKDLWPGTYYLELWATDKDNRSAVYPTQAFFTFEINKSTFDIQNAVSVSEITIRDLLTQINQRMDENSEHINSILKGKDGKSAYDVAVDNGFKGTQEQWLKSLVPASVDWSKVTDKPKLLTDDDLQNIVNKLNGDYDVNASYTPDLDDLLSDKSFYGPGENCYFTAISHSFIGRLTINYYNRERLIDTDEIIYHQSTLSWSWTVPDIDNQSYIAEIINSVNGKKHIYYYAINVSSDIKNLPIMGFISNFSNDDPRERKQVLDYLTRLHVNYLMYYDWADIHSVPLPTIGGATSGDTTFVAETWSDIGKRLIKKNVIVQYCEEALKRNMRNMAYMAINGSDTNQPVHGLSKDMWLYNDDKGDINNVYVTLSKDAGWAKYSLYNANWLNKNWQNYIYGQMLIALTNMPFNGWHMDMFGNPGNKYQEDGTLLTSETLASGFHYFIDRMKDIGYPLGLNSVSEYGLKDINVDPNLDYNYTEVWAKNCNNIDRSTYRGLQDVIQEETTSTDVNGTHRGTLIAGYMDYEYSKDNKGKQFNDIGVILTDLEIMALGAFHIEMGEHMISNEYFPNNNLTMSDSLKQMLIKMYDFGVGFKKILAKGYQYSDLATIDGGNIDNMQNGKVNGITRQNDAGDFGLSIINMAGCKVDQWNDAHATQNQPTPQQNVKVHIKQGAADHDWFYCDLNNPIPKPIVLDGDGSYTIPSLNLYCFIYGVKK